MIAGSPSEWSLRSRLFACFLHMDEAVYVALHNPPLLVRPAGSQMDPPPFLYLPQLRATQQFCTIPQLVRADRPLDGVPSRSDSKRSATMWFSPPPQCMPTPHPWSMACLLNMESKQLLTGLSPLKKTIAEAPPRIHHVLAARDCSQRTHHQTHCSGSPESRSLHACQCRQGQNEMNPHRGEA
ncbi:hypothetical protein P4O66_020498 [Electrophorus voltai]|uniref:Uncharacterized protein n=1 Tax=Electrophorus voltai TaxID=2609070 RepID=A0AAD8ZSP4_9TELE|nr:hypothetical protein P4O66_020498 [Electrophorus voltai]